MHFQDVQRCSILGLASKQALIGRLVRNTECAWTQDSKCTPTMLTRFSARHFIWNERTKYAISPAYRLPEILVVSKVSWNSVARKLRNQTSTSMSMYKHGGPRNNTSPPTSLSLRASPPTAKSNQDPEPVSAWILCDTLLLFLHGQKKQLGRWEHLFLRTFENTKWTPICWPTNRLSHESHWIVAQNNRASDNEN